MVFGTHPVSQPLLRDYDHPAFPNFGVFSYCPCAADMLRSVDCINLAVSRAYILWQLLGLASAYPWEILENAKWHDLRSAQLSFLCNDASLLAPVKNQVIYTDTVAKISLWRKLALALCAHLGP